MKNDKSGARENYKSVIKELPVGYSYNRLIRDEDGEPVDYEFLEVNQAFEDLTGLDQSKLIGTKGTEIFPELRKGKIDLIKEFGNMAKTDKSEEFREFEQFSKKLDRWYRIKAYSPQRNHIVAFFTDVTQEMKLASASEELLQQPRGEIDYQALTKNAKDISGAKFVSFNLFEEDGSFTTKAVSGPRKELQRAASVLGIELVGKTWDPDPDRWKKMKGQSIIHFDSITDLAGDRLNKSFIKWLEWAFSVGETVLARIQKGNQMVGDFTFVMPRGKDLEKDRLIEIYTRQVGSAIIRHRSEKKRQESDRKLKASKDRYQSYFEELGDAVFVLEMGGEDKGKILEVNSSAAKQTGYDQDELIGMNLFEDITVEGTAGIDFSRAIGKLERGEVVSFTEKKQRKNGTEYWTEVVTTQIDHKGKQANLSINRDVTEQIQAKESLKQERKKLRDLHDAVDELQRQNTEEEILQTAVEVVETMLDFKLCSIYILEEDHLVPKVNTKKLDSDETTFEIGEGITGKTIEKGETIWGEDVRDYPGAKPASEDFRAFISVPIGELGIIQVISEEVGSFTKQDVELVEILAGHLREELYRVRLEKDLRNQALKDPLTDLYNRRYFNEIIKKEAIKAKRYEKPLTFLMLDINQFKKVNDNYSHQTGDQVLKEIATLLKDNVRDADTAVRYGGDEFLVMMPETIGEADITVDRLKEKIVEWNEESDLLDFPLKLAMGVSHWSSDQDKDVEEAIKEADQKMYEDKRK